MRNEAMEIMKNWLGETAHADDHPYAIWHMVGVTVQGPEAREQMAHKLACK